MRLNLKISLIARALIKYGYSNFQLEILEYCKPSNCIDRQQYYIDLFKPEYNILKIARSKLGLKYSVEIRKKISLSLIGNKRLVRGPKSMIPYIVLDITTNVSTRYKSVTLIAKGVGFSPKAVRKYLNKNSKKPLKYIYIITKLNPYSLYDSSLNKN